jgi:hypothetical protein
MLKAACRVLIFLSYLPPSLYKQGTYFEKNAHEFSSKNESLAV